MFVGQKHGEQRFETFQHSTSTFSCQDLWHVFFFEMYWLSESWVWDANSGSSPIISHHHVSTSVLGTWSDWRGTAFLQRKPEAPVVLKQVEHRQGLIPSQCSTQTRVPAALFWLLQGSFAPPLSMRGREAGLVAARMRCRLLRLHGYTFTLVAS